MKKLKLSKVLFILGVITILLEAAIIVILISLDKMWQLSSIFIMLMFISMSIMLIRLAFIERESEFDKWLDENVKLPQNQLTNKNH